MVLDAESAVVVAGIFVSLDVSGIVGVSVVLDIVVVPSVFDDLSAMIVIVVNASLVVLKIVGVSVVLDIVVFSLILNAESPTRVYGVFCFVSCT